MVPGVGIKEVVEGFEGGGAEGEGDAAGVVGGVAVEVVEEGCGVGVVEEVEEGGEGDVVAVGDLEEGEGAAEVIAEEGVGGVGREGGGRVGVRCVGLGGVCLHGIVPFRVYCRGWGRVGEGESAQVTEIAHGRGHRGRMSTR